jgi:hypothetical protein
MANEENPTGLSNNIKAVGAYAKKEGFFSG